MWERSRRTTRRGRWWYSARRWSGRGNAGRYAERDLGVWGEGDGRVGARGGVDGEVGEGRVRGKGGVGLAR